jgi:CubicO group peptidase (beta-lactamase class C family)
MNRASLILITLFVTSTIWSQSTYYYPSKGSVWQHKSPTDFNMNLALFNKAIEFAKSSSNTNTKDLRQDILKGFESEPYHKILGPTKKRGESAGIILRNGYIIEQWGDVQRVDMTFSVTKSYLSTIAGLAFDRGLIHSLNEPLANYVWDEKFKGQHNSQITWEHLLNQSSDWSGELWDCFDWADRPPKEGGIDDWKNRALIRPGTKFEYNDVRVNLLAYCLLEVLRKPLPQILNEEIMMPIGASTTWKWYGYRNSWVNIDGIKMQSVSGGGHSGGGLFINTYDHARFGLLMLSNGEWKGNKIISKEWITRATIPSKPNKNYGFMWWLNNDVTSSHLTSISNNAFYASGFGGNYIIIEPDLDLVIVLRWFDYNKTDQFVKMILESIQK